MKTKEGHSGLIDWVPILGCLGVAATPWILTLFKPEEEEWHNLVGSIVNHPTAVSGLGIIGFLLVVLYHSLSDYDELAERVSYKRADGMWVRWNDRHSGIYKLEGKNLTGEFPSGRWNNNVSGHYDTKQGKFIIKTIRERPDKTDRAVLLGTVEVLNEDTLKVQIYSSDGGHEDVPVGWTELAYLERVKGRLPILPPTIAAESTSQP